MLWFNAPSFSWRMRSDPWVTATGGCRSKPIAVGRRLLLRPDAARAALAVEDVTDELLADVVGDIHELDVVAGLLPRASRVGIELNRLEPLVSERLALWNGDWMATKDACWVHRSQRWEEWRFSSEAGMSYQWVSARGEGLLTGYAVWGRDPRTGSALLSEICAPEPRVLRALVAEVVAQARQAGHPFLATVTSVPAIISALRANGFLRRARIPLIVRTLSSKLLKGNVHDHNSWRLLGADLDTY